MRSQEPRGIRPIRSQRGGAISERGPADRRPTLQIARADRREAGREERRNSLTRAKRRGGERTRTTLRTASGQFCEKGKSATEQVRCNFDCPPATARDPCFPLPRARIAHGGDTRGLLRSRPRWRRLELSALLSLRIAEDPMTPESAPADGGMPSAVGVGHRCPFPRRSAIWSAEAPCELEYPRGIDHRFDPEVCRPDRPVPRLDEAVTRDIECSRRLAKELPLVRREPLVVGLEDLGALEPHRSRSARNSSTSSKLDTCPAVTSASASCSIVCQRSVQNHA